MLTNIRKIEKRILKEEPIDYRRDLYYEIIE